MDELFDSETPALDSAGQRLTTSRRLEILASLRQEREKRRAMASQGQKYIIDHTDLTPVQPQPGLRSERIAKLVAERRQTGGAWEIGASPSVQMDSPVEIGYEDAWSMEPVEAQEDRDADPPRMSDNQPDYRPLANIYEAYRNVPEVMPVPVQRPKSASARTTSAPPKRSKTKEDLVKEAEEKLRAECTFRPKITQIPQGKAYAYSQKTNVENRFERLSRPKTEIIQKREKLKREIEEKTLAECVFKPKINQSARSSALDVSERLYREAENRTVEREMMKRMLEEEQVSLYAFQPQVQTSTSVLVGKLAERPPIYRRVNEVQRERQETLQRLRVASERNDPDLTFKPNINSKSAKLAEQRLITSGEAHLPISEKLSKDAQDKLTRQLQRAEESDIVRYSFEPQLSVSSQDYPKGSFLERQKMMAEKQKQRKEEIRAKSGAAEQCTFRPAVDRTSSIIVESMPERLNETESDRLQRLYKGDTPYKGKGKARAEQQIYSEVTFEPQINPISKTLGRSASLSELAYNVSKAQEKKQQAEMRVAEMERECTFQPQLYRNETFGHVESKYGQSKDVMRKIQEEEHSKQLKFEEMKKMKEFEELKNCTFQPEMIEPRLETDTTVTEVKGLDRFLQLKDLARRQEEERKLREEQVFKLNPKGHVSEVPYTIPQPFNLRPSTKQQKLERAQKEALGREKAQCTFQPQTMELRNRQMIQKLLANEV